MKERKNWKEYSDEELLDLIVKLGEELAPKGYRTHNGKYKRYKKIEPKEPTAIDLRKAKGYPSINVYINRFGSWNMAKYLAGFTETFENPWVYSREELIDNLVQESSFSKEFASKLLSEVKKEKKKN